jgi:hypothetical protein
MLLEELIKKTPPSHPDFLNLKFAGTQIQAVANYINEQKREYERKMVEAEIQMVFGKTYQRVRLLPISPLSVIQLAFNPSPLLPTCLLAPFRPLVVYPPARARSPTCPLSVGPNAVLSRPLGPPTHLARSLQYLDTHDNRK